MFFSFFYPLFFLSLLLLPLFDSPIFFCSLTPSGSSFHDDLGTRRGGVFTADGNGSGDRAIKYLDAARRQRSFRITRRVESVCVVNSSMRINS